MLVRLGISVCYEDTVDLLRIGTNLEGGQGFGDHSAVKTSFILKHENKQCSK